MELRIRTQEKQQASKQANEEENKQGRKQTKQTKNETDKPEKKKGRRKLPTKAKKVEFCSFSSIPLKKRQTECVLSAWLTLAARHQPVTAAPEAPGEVLSGKQQWHQASFRWLWVKTGYLKNLLVKGKID